ncbi:unnamed protein product [Prunus armeniaca]
MLVWRMIWKKACRGKIDRSTLWKKAREDKHSNILDPKVAEKAKLIQKQVSEVTLTVSGSNDVLTMALGPKHPGGALRVWDIGSMSRIATSHNTFSPVSELVIEKGKDVGEGSGSTWPGLILSRGSGIY